MLESVYPNVYPCLNTLYKLLIKIYIILSKYFFLIYKKNLAYVQWCLFLGFCVFCGYFY